MKSTVTPHAENPGITGANLARIAMAWLVTFSATYFAYSYRHANAKAGSYLPLVIGTAALFSLVAAISYPSRPERKSTIPYVATTVVALLHSAVFVGLMAALVVFKFGS